MATPEAIRIEGLKEAVKAFKELDAGLPKLLKETFNESGQLIADKTRPWVPRRSGRAAGSIKLASTASAAKLKHGGNRAPYVPWLDFGGTTGKGHRPRVGWSGSVRRKLNSGGRFMWRTLGKHSDEITENMNDGLQRLLMKSGLGVRRSG